MTRYERMKMQRRMQRRIRLVVEERRMALALPPPAVFTTPKGLEYVGPRAFGYDLPYKPVFA